IEFQRHWNLCRKLICFLALNVLHAIMHPLYGADYMHSRITRHNNVRRAVNGRKQRRKALLSIIVPQCIYRIAHLICFSCLRDQRLPDCCSPALAEALPEYHGSATNCAANPTTGSLYWPAPLSLCIRGNSSPSRNCLSSRHSLPFRENGM